MILTLLQLASNPTNYPRQELASIAWENNFKRNIILNRAAHKIEGVNCTQTLRFYHFVFTGKERDEETGYGYFGARYMDHELMTMWLSVDPMADKYPSMSPYSYCA